MSSVPIWARPEPGARRAALTRAQIARAALAIADRDGFAALSMRRVAAELGVGTMSLYHYIRTKDDLLALMDDTVMGEVLIPDGEMPADWRTALTAIAERSRAVWSRHPWMLTDPMPSRLGPNGLRHFDQSLQAVADLELSSPERLEIITAVDDYTLGYCMREQMFMLEEGDDTPWASLDDFARYVTEQLASGRFPHIADFVGDRDPAEVWWEVGDKAFDRGRFRRGLDRLLDGIALQLDGAAG